MKRLSEHLGTIKRLSQFNKVNHVRKMNRMRTISRVVNRENLSDSGLGAGHLIVQGRGRDAPDHVPGPIREVQDTERDLVPELPVLGVEEAIIAEVPREAGEALGVAEDIPS